MLIRFATASDREIFLQQIKAASPEVFSLARPSYAQPTTVSFRGLSGHQERWLAERAGAVAGAKVFVDVEFQTLMRA